MGFDTIWTAFEGAESGYGKLQGKNLEELYADLNARGVTLLSSMIIGFLYQNPKRILEEFDRLMGLGPSLTQILIYWKRARKRVPCSGRSERKSGVSHGSKD